MQKPKILIVDDEQQVCDFLSSFVSRKLECEVTTANDGKAALEKLKSASFDLVLLDIKMPGLSGIDLIKEAIKFSPKSKILAISAYDSQDVALEAIKAGAFDYILKSYSTEEIGIKIKDALAKDGKYSPRTP